MRFMSQFDLLTDIRVRDDIDRHPISIADYIFTVRRMSMNMGDGTATLHCNLEFDSPSLEQAKDSFMQLALKILDILALVTHAKITFSKVHKIFDWTPDLSMRDGICYVYDPPKSEPEFPLDTGILESASLLLHTQMSDELASALRWFRLAVAAETPQDQFQKFYFALEIVANHTKPSEPVHDQCAKCRSHLYCEKCGNYPTHRPYPKQAINMLCAKVAPENPEFFPIADKARNLMMHGASMDTVEKEINRPLHTVIDPLARITWLALLKCIVNFLPDDKKPTNLQLGQASTFVNWDLSAAALIQTVVPNGDDGKPDIELLKSISVAFT